MVAEDPEITSDCDGRLRSFRRRVLIGESFDGLLCSQQSRELIVFEAEQVQIEILFA